MPTRLTLLCAAATARARGGAFPCPDEPIDAGGRAKAAAMALPGARDCRTSPSRAARDTAAAMGLEARVEAALRDRDHGDWSGLALDDVASADGETLARWMAAPESAPPGGESMADVVARIAPWLEGVQGADRPILAITHPAVIRAALSAAIRMPVGAALAIDVAPLSTTILSFNGRWRLQELRRA